MNIKVVCIGDGAVGKSSALITYTENCFPVAYVPTVFGFRSDNFCSRVELDGKPYNLSLWDTAGQEEYSRLRTLSYPETDVFLLCFSVVSPASFDNIKSKWIPEANHHCPKAKLLLVGLKTDLRDDIQTLSALGSEKPITRIQAENFANSHPLHGYVECSSLTSEGLGEVFSTAMRFTHNDIKKKQKKQKNKLSAPKLPPAEKAPWINVLASSYGEDRNQIFQQQKQCDVCFLIGSANSIPKANVKPTVAIERNFEYIDDDIDEDLLCSICLEPFTNGVSHNIESCRNCFCKTCVSNLSRCPLCRGSLTHEELALIPRLVYNAINKLKIRCTQCQIEMLRGEYDSHTCQEVLSATSLKQQTKKEGTKRKFCAELFDHPAKISDGKSKLWAHQVMLTSSSTLFQRIFHVQDEERKICDFVDTEMIVSGLIPGICSIDTSLNGDGKSVTYITLSAEIEEKEFRNFLEFLYCGEPISMKKNDCNKVANVAKVFECGELVTTCDNLIAGNEWLNPSIATWINDENGAALLRMFAHQDSNKLTDVILDDSMRAHSPVVMARCPLFLKELENENGIIASCLKCKRKKRSLRLVLDYLYSDHCTIEENCQSQLELIEIAFELGLSRLVSLCELYISKTIEKETLQFVEEAKIDVIAILNTATKCKANQLRQFCLHFISVNYGPMSSRKEWRNLSKQDKKFVDSHKWPPQSYFDELSAYERNNHSSNCDIM